MVALHLTVKVFWVSVRVCLWFGCESTLSESVDRCCKKYIQKDNSSIIDVPLQEIHFLKKSSVWRAGRKKQSTGKED